MLDVGAEGASSMPSAVTAYHDRLLAIAPTAADIPTGWLPAAAIHLCTQVGERHQEALRALRGRAGWISVDPSPHYSRLATAAELWSRLAGANAFLPSANEVSRLLGAASPAAVALQLHQAGFAEVALKRGAAPVMVAAQGEVTAVATAPATVMDPTGAGDSFCGAYAACRLAGLSPLEAARRATLTAALVVGCSGVEAALQLGRLDA
jgi:ribokinase